MKPAYSVMLLTTLIGAGQGLFLAWYSADWLVMLDMLPEADEIFLSNTVRGIWPVRRIDHWEYRIGPVTREVQEWLDGQ